jgi:hypothetical protein
LVTDLPADFEVFGQAVDTSLADLKGGTTGQVLSKNSNTDMDFVWVTDAAGDITGVTAGTGITGGGTSGSVTVSFDQANFGGGQFAAGKNKIINGDFSVNQRNFTTTTTSGTYLFDRYSSNNTGGTVTYTAQTFALGAAPVAGYEGKNFLDIASTGQSAAADLARVQQTIESVRTLANQAVTISFWAKAASGTPKVAVEIQQIFGSGGSPSSAVNTYFGQATLSTSWARYSVTTTLPSISGKTIGTANDDRLSVNLYTSAGSSFNSRTGSLGIQTATISFWGIQVESGNQMTPFQTASGGSFQAELAMCQRFYQRVTGQFGYVSTGTANNTTDVLFQMPLPVQMRIAPNAITVSALADWKLIPGNKSISALVIAGPKPSIGSFYATSTGLTANQAWTLYPDGGTSGANTYIDFSAEL